jgi:hypothetical protein
MSGHPSFNFPAFDAASEDLRFQGYDIVSPAELDDPVERNAALASQTGDHLPEQQPWGVYLARDLKIVCDVTGVIVLPGWQHSRGARLETYVSDVLGKPIYQYPDLCKIARTDYVIVEENIIR